MPELRHLLLFLIWFTGAELSLVEITPAQGSSCPRGETCATKDSCDFWVEKENSIKNLPKSSPQWRQYVTEARAALCHRGKRALCCPQGKCDNLEEKRPSPGFNCASREVCATKNSCTYWKNGEESVIDLPKSDSRRKQYLSSVKEAICNRGERAVCCPLDKDSVTVTS